MNVTQTIPNYLAGVSQQPDYNKTPGSLRDCKNAYPDITYGLQKRHGARFEYDLGTDDDLKDGLWFQFRDSENIPYFGVILTPLPAPNARSASIKVWNSINGVEQTVTGDFSYLEKNDLFVPNQFRQVTKEAFKTTSINQVVVILNRYCKVLKSTTDTPGTIKKKVSDYAKLPTENLLDGDIYHVLNTDTQLDDYYVIWDGEAWEETVKPGISEGIQDNTMPHALVKTPSGFTFTAVTHEKRVVGNAKTNQHPSFVGSYIENVFFYLNRIGLLSQNNVVLSQPLVPDAASDELQSTNYYRVSTLTQSAADPVDLNASSVRAITLRSVQPTYQGIILFADGEQFIIYSEQGVITPQTAIIKSISTYEMYGDVNAIELGDEYYFISRTLRHTRVFKMVPRGIQEGPQLTEVTKIISDYIPNDIDTLVPNSQNGFISLASSNRKFMYIFRTFIDNGEIIFRSWYTWELSGTIKSCIFVKDRMYSITSQGGRYAVSSITLNTIPEEDILTNIQQQAGFSNYLTSIGPYLDLWVGQDRFVAQSQESQTTDSKGVVTTVNPIITMPDNYPVDLSGKEAVAITSVDSLSRGNALPVGTGAVFPVEESNGKWKIKGNFPGTVPNFVVGYRYDYDLYLPDYYLNSEAGADYTAHLNINRYKFIFKDASEVKILQKSWGRNDMSDDSKDWTEVTPTPSARYYALDRSPVDAEVEIIVPIHQRNTNFKMRITSDSPFPVTLNKLMWEGNYTPRYYRRV